DGAVVLAFIVEGGSAAAIGVRVFRVEPDRLVAVGDSAVVIAFLAVGEPALVVSGGEFRIEPDRLVEIGDGAVVVVLARVADGAREVGIRKIALPPSTGTYLPVAGGNSLVWIRATATELCVPGKIPIGRGGKYTDENGQTGNDRQQKAHGSLP